MFPSFLRWIKPDFFASHESKPFVAPAPQDILRQAQSAMSLPNSEPLARYTDQAKLILLILVAAAVH